jgi:hypothetical protein
MFPKQPYLIRKQHSINNELIRTRTNSWESISWIRTAAHHRETRLRIRIIPSVRLDFIIPNQHLITLKQTAVKYPRINIQPDFVGVIVSNVERSSFDWVSAFIAVWIWPAYMIFCSRFYFVEAVVFKREFFDGLYISEWATETQRSILKKALCASASLWHLMIFATEAPRTQRRV